MSHDPQPRTSAGSGATYCRVCYRPIMDDGRCKPIVVRPDTSTPEERAALNRLAREISGRLR